MPRGELNGAPQSRWRVVERDRRLEVIDSRTGERLAAPRAAEPPSLPPAGKQKRLPLVRQTRFDGGGELTTHRLYDSKAPRTIQLDVGSAEMIKRAQLGLAFLVVTFVVVALSWPYLLIVLALPMRREVRGPIRRWTTAWLDRVEREGS